MGEMISIVVYMDDIVLSCSRKSAMEETWDIMSKWCANNAMRIKAVKSAYTTNKGENACRLCTNEGELVMNLEQDEPYRYLGIQMRLDL
jgi:hypothetical protein